MQGAKFQEKSYWMTTRDYIPGEPLQENIDVDVAVVGGGFTGLSSAYHIKKAEPTLRVALLESQVIGFGASGRNGGFNMTLFGRWESKYMRTARWWKFPGGTAR
jgi:glycine/D-amino acid oxidase-like deaminating enzyme